MTKDNDVVRQAEAVLEKSLRPPAFVSTSAWAAVCSLLSKLRDTKGVGNGNTTVDLNMQSGFLKSARISVYIHSRTELDSRQLYELKERLDKRLHIVTDVERSGNGTHLKAKFRLSTLDVDLRVTP